jgi:hypothetical protein
VLVWSFSSVHWASLQATSLAKRPATPKLWVKLAPLVPKLVVVQEKLRLARREQAWVFASFDGQEVLAFGLEDEMHYGNAHSMAWRFG